MPGQEDFPLPLLAPQGPIITTPDVQPPRPPNSWILYRAWKLRQLPPPGPGEPRRSQSEVSTLLGQFWRNETSEIRGYFDRLADEAKALHKLRYPNYRYQPKKKEDSKPQPKRAAKTRGVSGQSNAANVLPAVERPGHPYPSSSRPPRDAAVCALPSPPLSAASSPGPSSPSSSYLPYSSASPVVDVSSPPSVYPPSDPPSRHLPTPVEESSAVAVSDTVQHGLAQLEELPNPDTDVAAVVWDYSNSTSLVQGVDWDTNALMNMNTNTQTGFLFDVALDPSVSEEILRCGHTENGPHQASCFLATSPEDIQNAIGGNFFPDSQSEIDISLGAFSGTGSIFEDGGNFYPNHNPLADVLDIPFYSRDMTTPSFNVDSNYFEALAASVIGNDINGDYTEVEQPFLPTDPTSVYYFQDQHQEGSSSHSANTSTYTPPSGAAQSATRRVGGNWSGYIRDVEPELCSASPFEVQAS